VAGAARLLVHLIGAVHRQPERVGYRAMGLVTAPVIAPIALVSRRSRRAALIVSLVVILLSGVNTWLAYQLLLARADGPVVAVPTPTNHLQRRRVLSVDHMIDRDRGAAGPIRVIRPMVVPTRYLVIGSLLAGFLAILPGLLTFVVSNLMAGGFEPVLGPAFVAYDLGFVVILALLGVRAFYHPGLTTYAISPDRIEFEEGLINRRR
jgi:hypothetical protein